MVSRRDYGLAAIISETIARCNEKTPRVIARSMAGGEGFEPPHTDPESAVLPARRAPSDATEILTRRVQFVKRTTSMDAGLSGVVPQDCIH